MSLITASAIPRGVVAAAARAAGAGAGRVGIISTRAGSSSSRVFSSSSSSPFVVPRNISTASLLPRNAFAGKAIFTRATHNHHHRRDFSSSTANMAASGTSSGHPITILTADLAPKLPSHSTVLFAAKKQHNLSFETIGAALGRDEIAAAALFYGQARATPEDVAALSTLLHIPLETLQATEITGIPDRGRSMEMPPKEPLMYRLYEIVQNYGYAYKAVINEKFGDGIMSAISYSTKVEREVDEKGEWVKITLRGKWLPYTRF